MHLGAASESSVIEVELLIGLGGFTAYQTLINSECYDIYPGVRAWVLTVSYTHLTLPTKA